MNDPRLIQDQSSDELDESIVSQQSKSESESSEEISKIYEIFSKITEGKYETKIEPTKRIKICHYDFIYLNSDILIFTLNSTLHDVNCGTVVSMIKYPTKLGMERWQEDVPREYDRKVNEDESSDDDEEYDENDDIALQAANLKYFNSSLKFYEVELVFDNIECAKSIMDSLDGIEIEKTERLLDLRYLRDDEVYDIPEDYQAMVEDLTSKLKHPPKKLRPIVDLPDPAFDMPWDRDVVKFDEEDFDPETRLDNESDLIGLSDVDPSNSEMSGTDGEDNADWGVMKFKRCRKRVKPEEVRRLLNFDVSESEEDEVDESEEEVGELNDEDNYSVTDNDESFDEDGEDDDSEDTGDQKRKRISNKNKMIIAMKEKQQKNEEKTGKIINFVLEKHAEDPIIQYFFSNKSEIKINQDSPFYKDVPVIQELLERIEKQNQQNDDGDDENDYVEVIKKSKKKKRKADTSENGSAKRSKSNT